MNAERDNGLPSDHSPYIDWDETIQLPSRKERFPSRNQKSKQKVKSKKMSATDVVPAEAPVKERKLTHLLTREQLRRRRKRYVKVMRFLRFVRRILIGVIGFVVLLLIVFWWKFVYVYDLPDYMQQQYPNVTGYIAWKPWPFGPPMIDLRSNGNPHTHNEIDSYLIRMDAYKDVIENPFIIWRCKE